MKDYYHRNAAQTGLIYSLNFALSLIPLVIPMNWLYHNTHRNILVAIIFHITAGCCNEVFATHPDRKVTQTGLLLLLSIVLVIKEKEFFQRRKSREDEVRLLPPAWPQTTEKRRRRA